MTSTEAGGPAENSPALGRVALALGILTLLISLTMAVSMLFPVLGLGWLQLIGVVAGLAAVNVSVIAIVRRRGRRKAVIGLVLAVAGPVLAWGLLLIAYAIQFSLYEPAG